MAKKGKKAIVVNVNTGRSKKQKTKSKSTQAEVTAIGRVLLPSEVSELGLLASI